jgi:hypothetical protein
MNLHPQDFRREGDYWTIAFDGRIVRVRDAKGIRYLSVLLRHPGESLPASTVRQLAERDQAPASRLLREPQPPLEVAERARVTVTKGIRAALQKLATNHPTLAAHLAATVRRGYFCVYRPDPRLAAPWSE